MKGFLFVDNNNLNCYRFKHEEEASIQIYILIETQNNKTFQELLMNQPFKECLMFHPFSYYSKFQLSISLMILLLSQKAN